MDVGLPFWPHKTQWRAIRKPGSAAARKSMRSVESPPLLDVCLGTGVRGLVSVIVPTFRRAELAARAVASALDQAYQNIEVILVDDGSPADVGEWLVERFTAEPRVRYVYKSNGGLSSARNEGLRLARGEYVAYLDDDDQWRPWKLSAQVACLEALAPYGVGMVWTNFDKVTDDGGLVKASAMWESYGTYQRAASAGRRVFDNTERFEKLVSDAPSALHGVDVHWGDVFSYIALGNMCLPSTVLLTRERAAKIGFFDESFVVAEDHDYHLRSCRIGPVAVYDASLTLYRVGSQGQLTHSSFGLQFALNHLRIILPVIQNERHRLTLPQRHIDGRLAAAYLWVGKEMAMRGDRAGARRHLFTSLARRPWVGEAWLCFLSTLVSPGTYARLRWSYHQLRRMWRGRRFAD